MNLTVEIPKWEHFEAVIKILNDAIIEQRNAYTTLFYGDSAKLWYQAFLNNDSYSCVIKLDGIVVAWGTLKPYRQGRGAFNQIKEVTFYVSYSAHGKGIGSFLLSHLEKVAESDGRTNKLIAILLGDNLPSRRMLSKHGYSEIGEFKGFAQFENKTTSHLFMAKSISTEN